MSNGDRLSPEQLQQALAQCASEPIHVLGCVQPHGVVLVFDGIDGRLTSYSDNVFMRLDVSPFEPAGSTLAHWVGEGFALNLMGADSQRRVIDFSAGRWGASLLGHEGSAHCHDGKVVIEIEPKVTPSGERPAATTVLSRMDSKLDQARTITDLARLAAQEISSVSGYLRTMVYRFDPDWNGEVLAEVTADGSLPLYLGKHFPAHDIPPQARRLYELSHVRVLVDAQAQPARLIAAEGGSLQPAVDLSYALLRSASPVHCEYLANMGVRGTLGLSLMVDGRLWGLVMCHHPSLRYPAQGEVDDVWNITRMLARAIAHRLQVLELETRLAAQEATQRWIAGLRAHAEQAGCTAALSAAATGLGALFDASVVLLAAKQPTLALGRLLPAGTIDWLLAEVSSRDIGDSLVLCEQLAGWPEVPEAPAGLLAIALGDSGWLVLGRDECVSERIWGGDPADSVLVDRSNWKISPRRSFEAWREIVTGRCRSWDTSDIECAQLVASALRELLLRDELVATARNLAVLSAGIARANDAIIITEAEPFDAPGPRILFVNPAFERMTGYRADEVIGRSPRILQGPGTDREAVARLGAALRAWQPVRMELLNYTKAGTPFWLEMDIAPVADETGWFTHWISIERDVSARKQLELALRDENQLLESRVEQRTRELSEAMERAQSANRAKSEFLANMSHELRSPLHSVLGFARLAAEDMDNLSHEQLLSFLAKIDRNATNLLVLVNDLLDSAKIESRSFTIEVRMLDLAQIARDVIEEFLAVRTDEIQVTLRSSGPTRVEGDPERLAQVLRNLVANALRFAPSRTLVEVCVETNEAGCGVVEVLDRGPGVPEAELELIFDRFAQSTLTNTGAGGSGLGLAIARGIVELHNGQVSARNRPGGGAIFRVELPLFSGD